MRPQVNGCPIRPATLCLEYDLRAARLRGADLSRADLSRSDLTGADLGGASLVSIELRGAKLNRANLSGADLARADLDHAELHSANLASAQMAGANLRGAELNGARVDGAQLRGADLSNAQLSGASLRNAKLERADLTGATLENADLSGADLTGANLSNATLHNTNLTGARLLGTILEGAKMAGCKGCPSPVSTAPEKPPASPAPISREVSGVSIVDAQAEDASANGCWARLYLGERYTGQALTLTGPVEVSNITGHWGFPWDPLYESVEVGPKATLSVFDQPRFRERTMVFQHGQRVADLDTIMGLFRSIRSAKVSCS